MLLAKQRQEHKMKQNRIHEITYRSGRKQKTNATGIINVKATASSQVDSLEEDSAFSYDADSGCVSFSKPFLHTEQTYQPPGTHETCPTSPHDGHAGIAEVF